MVDHTQALSPQNQKLEPPSTEYQTTGQLVAKVESVETQAYHSAYFSMESP